MNRFHLELPRVRQSLSEAALKDAYPTLLLTLTGEIRGVNPLALWLWGGLVPGEPLQAERLLGVNIYNMIARNFDRLPVEQNRGLYVRMSAIVKSGIEHQHPIDYHIFVERMLAHPGRAAIFQSSEPYEVDGRDYTMYVYDPFQPDKLLEFSATSFRVENDAGFLVVYYPVDSSIAAIEEVNSRLIEYYGEGDDTIVLRHGEPTHIPLRKRVTAPYRSYYPHFIQDPLWYLTDENEAHRLLLGSSVLNLHFFEMFLSPLVKYMLGPIQDSTAPRALKYFDFFTSRYLREDHEMHAQYMQTMRKLSRIEGFDDLLSLSRRMPIHLNPAVYMHVLTATEAPFYTCRVILPWRYDPDIHLEFRSMVNFIYMDSINVDIDKRHYQDTLVPSNGETDAALMLLHLFATAPSASEPGKDEDRLLWQLFWLLSVLRVVEEGLATDESNTTWNPEEAFRRVRKSLALRYGSLTSDMAYRVKTEIFATLEVLERTGKVGKVRLLALLHSYLVTQPHLSALRDILAQELEV